MPAIPMTPSSAARGCSRPRLKSRRDSIRQNAARSSATMAGASINRAMFRSSSTPLTRKLPSRVRRPRPISRPRTDGSATPSIAARVAPQLFDLRAPALAFEPALSGAEARLCLVALRRHDGCPPDQVNQLGKSILAIAILGTMFVGGQDQYALAGDSAASETDQPRLHLRRQRRVAGHIETKLHGACHLVDVLAAGSG